MESSFNFQIKRIIWLNLSLLQTNLKARFFHISFIIFHKSFIKPSFWWHNRRLEDLHAGAKPITARTKSMVRLIREDKFSREFELQPPATIVFAPSKRQNSLENFMFSLRVEHSYLQAEGVSGTASNMFWFVIMSKMEERWKIYESKMKVLWKRIPQLSSCN